VREARAGDRFLLCSDGLSGVVSLETLDEAIRIPDPQACADRMIELALKGGGPDNVTVIVADVEDVDFGEDTPILGGAAGDGSEDHQPPPDSAASRASAITSPRQPPPQRVEPPVAQPDPRRRRKTAVKIIAVMLALLLLAAGGLFATRWWINRQYYVGASEDGKIKIFRGVNGSVFGVKLQSEVEGSCPTGSTSCTEITLDDLQPAGRNVVKDRITDVDGLEGARAAVRLLRTQHLLPTCDNKSKNGTSSPTTPTTPSSTPSSTAPSTDPSVSGETPFPTSTQQPGVNCREGS
jgi:PPM family protein phosphatase